MKVLRKGTTATYTTILVIGSIIMLYPLAYSLLGCFSSVMGFLNNVGILPTPEKFSYFWDNLVKIVSNNEIQDSIVITLLRFLWYMFIVGMTSVLAGYAFAKIRFAGRKIAFYILMSSMMIPGVALLIPQYLELYRFPLVGGNDIHGVGGNGFGNNVFILFITGCFSAYNIFLIKQTLEGLGDEYREAAEIDGASFFLIVFRIYFPMLLPVLSVIVIQLFIGQWNDYMFPLLYLPSLPEYWTIGLVSVRMQSTYLGGVSGTLSGYTDYPFILTMAVFMMTPPIVVFIIFQKSFVEGLSAGGVKS